MAGDGCGEDLSEERANLLIKYTTFTEEVQYWI